MSDEPSGVRAFLDGAGSPSYSVRARSGRRLAPLAADPAVARALAALLLDAADTAVIRQTAGALVRAGTPAALRLLAAGWGAADDQQADWLATGVHDALAEPDGADRAAAVSAYGRHLAGDPEAAVRRGAVDLCDVAERAVRRPGGTGGAEPADRGRPPVRGVPS
ncbi:hypothetical protein [Streptomyces subrutilus]|uniref:hypothetical protein n=1 Tax=Streptomyces subrutilus TaxID=36818 RepID=UPI0033CCDBCB